MDFTIPILSGTYTDLTKFDFSFKDIIIYDIQSNEFGDYLETIEVGLKHEIMDTIEPAFNDIYEFNKKYAVVKKDVRNNYSAEDIANVWKFLVIVFPSDIQVEHEVHVYEEDGKFRSAAFMTWQKLGYYPDAKLLIAHDDDIDGINQFAAKYFDRLKLDNYIGMAIENYITSFTASHLHYQYVALCTTLECVIDGKNEITYRLRRALAVLCGRDRLCSSMIFENMGKFYDLRSRIVHGEKYTTDEIHKYLLPLTALVSRTIIELLIHNIETNRVLGRKITELGFGERAKLTPDWKEYNLNTRVTIDANWTDITGKFTPPEL